MIEWYVKKIYRIKELSRFNERILILEVEKTVIRIFKSGSDSRRLNQLVGLERVSHNYLS